MSNNVHVQTVRLILRDLLPTDDAGMFELDSDMDVHKYIGRKPVRSIEDSRDVINIIRSQYIANGIGRWAIIEKTTGNFIGWGGLKLITEPINERNNYYDLGYRIIKKYWGKGYATEIAKATIQYARNVLKIQDVYGMANIENLASCRVLEKAGMIPLGTFYYEGIEHRWYQLSKECSM